ncbi:MAG: hypothetical protein AAFO72_08295 [Pseudomonadota bacterium]
MKVSLHIGAHRTGATSFQHYLAENATRLRARGICALGPDATRDGWFTGIVPLPNSDPVEVQLDRATTRLALNLSRLRHENFRHLVLSDANIMGTLPRNLRMQGLYRDLGERVARFYIAFNGDIDRVVLTIRSQESLWASVFAQAVTQGQSVPDARMLDALCAAQRSWRDVVLDLACALPGVEIQVMPYEIFGGLPERLLEHMTGMADMPRLHARAWLAKSSPLERLRQIVAERGDDPATLPAGAGRWRPFGSDQVATLREAYADDLFWLRSGAEGLACIVEETGPVRTGRDPASDLMKRGRSDGIEKRSLA